MTDKRAYIHFRRRCQERFGIVLSEAQVAEIGRLCHDGSYAKIHVGRDGVGLYRVKMGSEMGAVAYDRAHRTVLTIMPLEWTGRAYRLERERELALAEEERTADFFVEAVGMLLTQLEEENRAVLAQIEDASAQAREQAEQIAVLESETDRILAEIEEEEKFLEKGIDNSASSDKVYS